MQTNFIPGLELSKHFYCEAVRPILDAAIPGLPHSAALLGAGSEVLGFDTAQSTDHDWGPHVILFLNEGDYSNYSETLTAAIRQGLPAVFRGNPLEPEAKTRDVRSIEIVTIRQYWLNLLGFDIQNELEPADWLTFTEQGLLEVTRGAVHWDRVGLQDVRKRFDYYPVNVWLYLLACGWNRIGQEEHLAGRTGMVGDEIGSAIIAARLVRDLMRLCFLMEKQYAPYPKWFGTAFSRLACANELVPVFQKILSAPTWDERQKYLSMAYETVAAMHNRLNITQPLEAKVCSFYGRPYLVIFGGRFTQAILEQITDPTVKRIASKRLIGSVDQFSDSTESRLCLYINQGLLNIFSYMSLSRIVNSTF